MTSAIEFAKYFIKNNLDTNRNTYDGNMKLQKLLFFANFVSLAENGKPLFNDLIYAFSNGCVIENVRLRYKNDLENLCKESDEFDVNFSKEDQDTLNLTIDLFGKLSARELSEINHNFSFWKNSYESSLSLDGYKNKEVSTIDINEITKETYKLEQIIRDFKSGYTERRFKEIIYGVTFYYPDGFNMTDEILEELEEFALLADDNVYSIYFDNKDLVVY